MTHRRTKDRRIQVQARAAKTVVREPLINYWAEDPRTDTLNIFPDGTMTLNGQRILKSELPAWAKKYV